MGKLRVFISSTMKDMVNERKAVVRQLQTFNFEPANAEGWLPDGRRSWERIEREIQASDVFVLIVGEKYGWIPKKGPKSGLGLSVTELEVTEAKALGLPILPFIKRLTDEHDTTSAEALRRRDFCNRVSSWEDGGFVAKFDDAFDLAEKVAEAVIDLLTDDFQQKRIRSRAQVASTTALALAKEIAPAEPNALPALPPRLVHAVASKKAVLFAGSGVSLAAGLPSAAFFAQNLIQIVRHDFPAYEANPVGSAFAGIATDVEGLSSGRAGLVAAVLGMVRPPQGLQPTPAHLKAVTLFEQIVTTNYDMLFEEADKIQGDVRPVISSELSENSLPGRAIVALHGTAERPDSLVLTERDVLLLDHVRPRLWKSVRDLLANKMVIVLGSSLRDPSIVRLFTEAGAAVSGYFVVPALWGTTIARLRAWNLECIRADAESFINALAIECQKVTDGEKPA